MYRISEFSKITNLTVKALRYYDEQGILVPSHRDSQNGYRYYSEEDFKRAQLVALLRSFDFSISEQRDVMENFDEDTDLAYFLEEKKAMIEHKIEKEKELLKKISLYIGPTGQEKSPMQYKIEVKRLEPVMVASIRYQGLYSEVGKYIARIYKAVKGNAGGGPFNLYYNEAYQEKADIEICVPVKRYIEADGIECRTLPAVERVVSTTHQGSYSQFNHAYKALLDYSRAQDLKLLTPSREIYMKGPGAIFRGNENKYMTEIVIPFA